MSSSPAKSLSRVSSVSDKGDGMVHHHVPAVVAPVEDATVVGAPVRGSHRGGEWALSGKVVHESGGIVVGQSLEAHRHHSCIRGCRVKLANIVVASASTCIGVVVFCDNSEERSVGVGQRLNGTHAAAGSSTLKWVWRTADKVLGAQLDQVVSHVVDLGIRSQDRGGGKSPAGATSSLVPHHGDDSLVPPVNRLRQIGNLCLEVIIVVRLAWSPRGNLAAGVSRHKLFLGEVSELVDPALPRLTRAVMLLNLCYVLCKDGTPECLLSRAAVDL